MKSQAIATACNAAIVTVTEIQNANASADPAGKIDWSKVRAMLAQILAQVVPIILPIILLTIDPTRPADPTGKTV